MSDEPLNPTDYRNPDLVHWSGEGVPASWGDRKISDDPDEVTCPDCLRMIKFLDEIKE